MKSTHATPPPEKLLVQYTPLLFRIVSGYLSDPEDMKEVVNDTFFEFYRCEERFDAEKGSVAAFLTTIAKRKAIDRLRSNKRQPVQENIGNVLTEPEAPIDIESSVTERLVIEDALGQLDKNELELIRAKYYDGKSLHEIAQEMHLPYETVKKRHQRSIKKLRMILLVVILAALILAACAYVAVKMGFVPGFGVSTTDDKHLYLLAEPVSVQVPDTELTITYTSVTCEGNTMICHFTLTDADGNDYQNPLDDDPVYGDETHYSTSFEWRQTATIGDYIAGEFSGSDYCPDVDTGITTYETAIYEYSKTFDEIIGALDDSSSPIITCKLICSCYAKDTTTLGQENDHSETVFEVTTQLQLIEISQESMDDYAYEYVDGQGGLIAVPRLENGRLIVAIYPIQPEVGVIYTGLTETTFYDPSTSLHLDPSEEYPDSTIYAVSEDGTVLNGTCMIDYYNTLSYYYYEWDFGPAEPGKYTIIVPYVFKAYGFSTYTSLSMELTDCTVSSEKLQFNGGTIQLTGLEAVTYEELEQRGYDCFSATVITEQDQLWILDADVELTNADESVWDVMWNESTRSAQDYISGDAYEGDIPYEERVYLDITLSHASASHMSWLHVWHNGQLYFDADEPTHYLVILPLRYTSSRIYEGMGIIARWDHQFKLEITVE